MKTLFFGPLPPPFHGQSLAFQKALNVTADQKILIDINLTGKSFFKKVGLSVLILIKLFYFFFLRKRPDIVYFTCSRSLSGSLRDVFLLQFSGLFKVPVVNHLHGADFKEFYYRVPRLYRAILKNSYFNVQHSIVLTDAMRDQFDMFPYMKVSVVNNFFDENIGLRVKNKGVTKGTRFVFLSNIMKTKGVFILLDAYRILKDKYPNIELTIAGSPIGDYDLSANDTFNLFNDYLEKLSGINYLGVVQGDAKIQLLNESSVFVLPSYHKSEAIPLSIIEAMASGCAIITSEHNYLPSLVGQDNGLLVKPNDVMSLVEAMENYILNPELLQSHQQNNVVYASSNFSEESYLSGIQHILELTLRD
jgi:glycosyltransferase involved in cell wall biosynthesis